MHSMQHNYSHISRLLSIVYIQPFKRKVYKPLPVYKYMTIFLFFIFQLPVELSVLSIISRLAIGGRQSTCYLKTSHLEYNSLSSKPATGGAESNKDTLFLDLLVNSLFLVLSHTSTYLTTSFFDLLVNSRPVCPRSWLLSLWRLSLYSSSCVLPKARDITLFFPK